MNIKLGPPKVMDLKPRITVIGIGGAGCNAINNMIATRLDGVEFIVANTDAQSLGMSNAEHRIQLGTNLTEGLGAGARPEVGEAAAREAEEDIRAEIAGSHMVFIAAGMGGGTGTGAAAVIAEIARDLGILTVGIVSKPFQFEGARRMRTAESGIERLEKVVDTLIVIPNQNLFRIANERTTFAEAFRLADQVLYSGIACIVDLIVKEGLINLDFADVQAVMKGMGTAMMGTGEATGEDRALAAANEAIANPLLDNISLSGAQGLLISIVGGSDLTLYEVDTAASHIRKEVAADANIIVGATTEEGMDERIRVSIVASGLTTGSEKTQPVAANVPPPAVVPKPAPVLDMPVPAVPASAVAASAHTVSAANDDAAAKLNEAKWHEPDDAGFDPIETEVEEKPAPAPQESAATAEMDADEADEFARALSEAMQEAASKGEKGGDAVWQSSDGVVVEEGFAGSRGHQQPPPLPNREKLPDTASAGGFEPEPPAEVRRTTTRVPEMSEFPEVAQREYFAKMEAAKRPVEAEPRWQPSPPPERSGAPVGRADTEPMPSVVKQAAEPPQSSQGPKPGLLRRWTGGGRK